MAYEKLDKALVKEIYEEEKHRFVKIGSFADNGILIIDRKTGVEYYSPSTGDSSALTVLVDKDGKPLINERFRLKGGL